MTEEKNQHTALFLKYGKTGDLRHLMAKLRKEHQIVGMHNGQPRLDRVRPLPEVVLRGTVKLHGANAGVLLRNGILSVQSRNRVVTVDNDMLNFYQYVMDRKELLEEFEIQLRQEFELAASDIIRVSGEWCGEGVQTRVALAEFPRRFWVLFDITIFASEAVEQAHDRKSRKLDMHHSVVKSMHTPSQLLYVITHFQSFEVKVNMNQTSGDPGIQQIKQWTDDVARQCPVSQTLGVTGPGEGIVWVFSGLLDREDSDGKAYQVSCVLAGKTKAGQFKATQKVKASYNSNSYKEKVAAFVAAAVSNRRCEQGMEYLREMNLDLTDRKSAVPAFIQWVTKDVFDECGDVMADMQLEVHLKPNHKRLTKGVAAAAVEYFNAYSYLSAVEG